MNPEMLEKIDAARGDWNRSRYIRHAIRMCDGSPFDKPEDALPVFDEQGNVVEGAA